LPCQAPTNANITQVIDNLTKNIPVLFHAMILKQKASNILNAEAFVIHITKVQLITKSTMAQ